jgi:hypothetical protein
VLNPTSLPHQLTAPAAGSGRKRVRTSNATPAKTPNSQSAPGTDGPKRKRGRPSKADILAREGGSWQPQMYTPKNRTTPSQPGSASAALPEPNSAEKTSGEPTGVSPVEPALGVSGSLVTPAFAVGAAPQVSSSNDADENETGQSAPESQKKKRGRPTKAEMEARRQRERVDILQKQEDKQEEPDAPADLDQDEELKVELDPEGAPVEFSDNKVMEEVGDDSMDDLEDD